MHELSIVTAIRDVEIYIYSLQHGIQAIVKIY